MTKDGGLRELFRQHLPDIHWVSIESPLTGAGIPDVNGCLGREFWIEFKQCSANAVRIDKFQVAWNERRHRAGGLTFLAVRQKERLYLFRGQDIRAIFLYGLRGADPLLVTSDGVSTWDWPAVKRLLTGRPV